MKNKILKNKILKNKIFFTVMFFCLFVFACPAFASVDLPDIFVFASGAGGWSTEMTIFDDWSFAGEFHDSDMGETGPGYPEGTVYISTFSGFLTEPEQISPTSLKFRLFSMVHKEKEGEEEYSDGVRYVGSTPYGLDGGDEFILYLPGTPYNTLSEDCRNWIRMFLNYEEPAALPEGFFVFYNVKDGYAFVGQKDSASSSRYITIPYLNETRFELSDFVGGDYRSLLSEAGGLSVLEERADEIKIGNGNVSITARSDGMITRVRLDAGDHEYCVEGVCSNLGTSDLHYVLWNAGYTERDGSKDGMWRIFTNEEKGRFLAYRAEYANVDQLYYGLIGYMPIS